MKIEEMKSLEMVSKEGLILLAPCWHLAVYLDGPLEADILDFHDRARASLGDRLTHYVIENMRGPAKINDRANTAVKTWIDHPRMTKTYHAWFLGNKDEESSASMTLSLFTRPKEPVLKGAQLEAWKASIRHHYGELGMTSMPPVTMLHVTLPLDHPLAESHRFLEWVKGFKVLQSPHLVSGHAGLGINLSKMRISLPQLREDRLASILINHPGIDWEDPSSVARSMSFWDSDLDGFVPRIKRVNWITIVSERTISWMGGTDTIKGRLAEEEQIVLHPLSHGLAVQAGKAPEPGDIAKHEILPLYRRVASVFKGVRLPGHLQLGGAFTQEVANEWLRALDEE